MLSLRQACPLLAALPLLLAGSEALGGESPSTASAPAAASGTGGRPLHRVESTHALLGRVNPLGLIYLGRLQYQLRLYASDEPALADNYVGIGLLPSMSPAYARLGVGLELQPASVLNVFASYEVIGYFGTFDVLQSFPGVLSDFSDSRLDELGSLEDGNPAKNYGASGTQLTVGARLQGKVGPVAARNTLRFFRPQMDLREGDRTFYDITFDVLAPNEGWFLVNDLDVLWVTELGLKVGARWTYTQPFYEARHYAEGEDITLNPNGSHRVGPLLTYTFWDDGLSAAFDRPTLILLVNWWIDHPFRTGVDVEQAVPYVVLGFSVSGDLLR